MGKGADTTTPVLSSTTRILDFSDIVYAPLSLTSYRGSGMMMVAPLPDSETQNWANPLYLEECCCPHILSIA